MSKYIFNYNVRLDDLDYMGIVGNAHWVTILERARIELLEKISFPFSEMLKRKVGGVVAEAHIQYRKPAYFNDLLSVSVTPLDPFAKGLYLQYRVDNQKSEECISAKIKIVFVDAAGQPVNMPDEISEKLFVTQ